MVWRILQLVELCAVGVGGGAEKYKQLWGFGGRWEVQPKGNVLLKRKRNFEAPLRKTKAVFYGELGFTKFNNYFFLFKMLCQCLFFFTFISCVGVCMCHSTHEEFKGQLVEISSSLLSSVWVLGIELGLPDLVASTFLLSPLQPFGEAERKRRGLVVLSVLELVGILLSLSPEY